MSFAQPFSNYEILARIGSGAMGTVFKARQKHMNRIVALKVLKPALARDERFVERLRREARIVGKLNHPNIVTGYDLGEEGGYHFFVMEYVEGRSLRQLLHEWGMFPEEQVLDVAMQIAGALAHAYDCGVIHRDVKPGNILIDKDGRVKLTDMGLAKVETDLQLTREGATVGTPQYISPEQARDPRSADARSDLYSLGATLFHMATGQTPFHADTIGELITKVLHDRPPTAISVNPALSDGLSLVIRKLLAKDPDLRYQTPGDLLVDLQRLQRHEKPAIDRSSLEVELSVGEASGANTSAGVGRSRRSWAYWALGAVALALSIVAVSLFVFPGLEDGGRARAQASAARFQSDWRDAATFRARADVLAAGRTAGVDEIVLAGALDELEKEMRSALVDVLAAWRGARRGEAMAWLGEPDHFADAGAFASGQLLPDLVDKLGFRPEALPSAGLRRDAAQGIAELRAELDTWCEGLVAGLTRRVERHLLGPVRDEVLELARAHDFDGARRTIAGGVDAFLGREGRPSRDQLTGAAGEALAGLESRVRETLLADVTEVREAAQRQALAELDSGLAALGRVRDQESSLAARLAALGRGAARLEADGDASERELGPFEGELREAWDAARARLAAVALEVDSLRAGVVEAAANEVLAFAYRCLLEAGPSTALAMLGEQDGAPTEPGVLAAHRAALASARVWERALAASLRERGGDARVRPGSGDDWVDATSRPVSFGDVDWAALLAASAPRPVPEDPVGRALLLLTAGRHAQAVEGLPAASLRFVEAEIWPRLRAAREAERSASVRSADAVLARAVERRAAGDAAGLRAALDDLDARFPVEPSAPSGSLRAELRLWLAAQESREELLSSARRRLPMGFDLRLLDGDRVRAAGAMTQFARGGQGAPVASGDEVSFRTAAPVFEVPVPLARPGAIRFEVEVRFPREDQLTTGLALQIGGVTAALAVLPEGQVGTVLTQGSASLLGDDEALRRALAGPLAAAVDLAPQVTHGAWHRLEVEWVRRRADAVEVQIGWVGTDGPRLASGRFTVRDPGDGVRIRALGPVGFREVVVEAVPDGG